ncbi:MAG: hypothetical protein ICV72_11550, partial [Aldersonia sp.]|nr:hypothetical protein [Aldersonia sp.]
VLAGGAPATAANYEFGQVQTLANGAVFCGGNIRTWATTSPDWPGRAIINVQSLPMGGYGGGSSVTPVCNVPVKVAWRNVNSGRTGAYDLVVVAGIYGSLQYALFQDTGPGRVVADVTTGAWHIPARGEFDVP